MNNRKKSRTKIWFFEKINKIDKPLARFIKKKRESTHINRMRDEKGKSLQAPQKYRIIRQYYEKLYANKLDNLQEMDNFLEKYNLLRLIQEETENLNRPIASNKIESVIKKLPKNKTPRPDGFIAGYYLHFV